MSPPKAPGPHANVACEARCHDLLGGGSGQSLPKPHSPVDVFDGRDGPSIGRLVTDADAGWSAYVASGHCVGTFTNSEQAASALWRITRAGGRGSP